MDKSLIEIYVPILFASYDVFIPKDVQMYNVLELVKKAVTDLSEGRFVPNANTVLCFRDSGKIVDINKSANELEIKNGSELMLI